MVSSTSCMDILFVCLLKRIVHLHIFFGIFSKGDNSRGSRLVF